ncbi:MAG: TlpA family protein disulfide reductase [Acidobacteria bacterium]|nr:TlpA family protein disulfide reductase [Acidobacteriota bacterium]
MRRPSSSVARGFAGALAVALLLCGVVPARAEGGMSDQKFKPGQEAPDFTVKDLAGADVKLSSFEGNKVVLLNFWGLRCGACLEEMPYLEDISKRYQDKGVVVLGVDTDGVGAEDVVATLKDMELVITYPLLLDPEFKVTDTYTNFLVPLTIVIDRKGVITYIHTGFEKGAEKHYEDAVKKAL